VDTAAHRRLKTEFGFDTALDEVFRFIYRSLDRKSGLTEYEFDHVLVGNYDGVPEPNSDEIDDWKWIDPAALEVDLKQNPDRYTPWFRIAFAILAATALNGEQKWKADLTPAR
jgi:isopentenyl-diphosphate delta-isomerase